MTEPKPLMPGIHLPTLPTDPSTGLAPERVLEALDIHGEGVPETRAAEGPLTGRTTIIERQNSWNNRRDAARDIGPPTGARRAAPEHQPTLTVKAGAPPSAVERTPKPEAVWPVVVEPADRDAVGVWRSEGDPN